MFSLAILLPRKHTDFWIYTQRKFSIAVMLFFMNNIFHFTTYLIIIVLLYMFLTLIMITFLPLQSLLNTIDLFLTSSMIYFLSIPILHLLYTYHLLYILLLINNLLVLLPLLLKLLLKHLLKLLLLKFHHNRLSFLMSLLMPYLEGLLEVITNQRI